jgi:hypothetical protein
MIFAILFLGEAVHQYQLVAMGVVIAAMYGLLYANAKKARLLRPESIRQQASPAESQPGV